MEIELAYGKGSVRLSVPDNIETDIFAPMEIDKPVRFEGFHDGFLDAGGMSFLSTARPLMVVNDGHRKTPTSRLLTWLDRIDDGLLDRAHFLIAAGTHESPTEDHLRFVFGEHLERVRSRTSVHDCRNLSQMTMIGQDQFGEDVYVNRALFEYDAVGFISSVEPHYFAGFTGGRKSIFPGLTNFATVERNHNLANSLEAAPMVLAGNPVAEHMEAMMAMVRIERVFSIQAILDSGDQIAAVFCGDNESAFIRSVIYVERMFGHEIDAGYDAVICELRAPLDGNLYQAQKALENCQAGVKDGGTAVVLSACEDGVGSEHFWNLADGWNREKNYPANGGLKFGSHKLSRVNSMSRRIRPCLHSTLDADTVRRVFYEPMDDVQEMLDNAGTAAGRFRLAVVRDAGNTVLKLLV